MKISVRIFLGFGVVIAIFVVQILVSHIGFDRAADTFDRYGRINTDTTSILEIEGTVLELQRSTLAFTTTGYDGLIGRIRKQQAAQEELLSSVEENVTDGQRRDVLRRMRERFLIHRESFEATVEQRQERDDLVRQGADLSHRIEASLGDLVASSLERNDMETAALAGAARGLLLRAHLDAINYVASPDAPLEKSTLEKLSQFRSALDELASSRRDDALARTSGELTRLTSDYERVFVRMVQATRTYMELVYVVMAGESAEIRHLASELKEHTLRIRGAVELEMTEDVSRFQRLSLMVSALAILVGISFAWWITRWTTLPIKLLTKEAEALAQGKLDEPVHVEGGGEIAQLATSFDLMREALRNQIEGLEEKIRERTIGLEQAVEELEGARRAADAANRAKSDFLANMSHELRTPMNAIIGYSEMLMEEAEDMVEDRFSPDLRKINAAGKHLLALINDILDLSKIEAGRMELFLETVPLGELLRDVVTTVDSLIQKNENTLATEIAEDLGEIRGDVTKIRQVLFNLVSNAAKFTDKGTITLRANREVGEAGDWLTISVSDTGIGIAADKIDSLYQEFTQADASTTRRFGGTGLGLAISKRFCVMMGGTISIDSKLGEGSTFTVRLPAIVADGASDKAPEVSESEVSKLPSKETGPIVLVIDDDEAARDLISRTLNRDGYRTVTAADGATGVDLARELAPSMITLDVMMPSMDGWEVLSALKAEPATRDIPVVMVTIVDSRVMGYSLGAAEYLLKPIERERLLEVVERLTGGRPTGTILVVDDDPVIREMLQRSMSPEGWTVVEAENGEVGLRRVAEAKPDLIVLDLMMPVMDGFEFLLRLRVEQVSRRIPVVVVSAKSLTREERERLNGNVDRILRKGTYDQDELLRDLRDLMAHSTGHAREERTS